MTQKELAQELGLSTAQVSRLKSRGMPVTTVEAASRWRGAHSKEGLGHKSGAKLTAAAVSAALLHEVAKDDLAPTKVTDDPAGTLARMRELEGSQYSIVQAARARAIESEDPEDFAVLSGMYRAYNVAATNALNSAKEWERHCRATGEVAPVEHLRNVLTSRLDPLAAQLRNFAANVAAKANPANPAMAEAAIAKELEAILKQIGVAKDSPVPPAPAAMV